MSKQESQSLAMVYAEALFGAAEQAGVLPRVEQEMLALRELLAADVRFRRVFETPTISFADKQRIVNATLGSFSEIVRNFMLVVIRKDRVGQLGQIVDAFHAFLNRKAGIAEFTVEAARQMEASELDALKVQLESCFTGRKIVVLDRVKPELLGGFVLAHEDRRWDCSVIHRLGRLVGKIESVKPNLGVWSQSG